MGNEYEVKITRHALEQMRVIAHYISYDLMAPEAAEKLLDDLKSEIMKLAILPKKHSYSRRDQIKQLQKMDMQ